MVLLLFLSIQYDLAKSMYGVQALLWNPEEVLEYENLILNFKVYKYILC